MHACRSTLEDPTALAAGADGVHLGQGDLSVEDARRALAAAGRELVVGCSTHDLDQACRAAAAGADYLGLGPIFATSTKRDPEPVVGLEILTVVVRTVAPRPVVAIGGITVERAPAVARTGAAAIAAIAAVNGAPDVVAAGRALDRAWRSG